MTVKPAHEDLLLWSQNRVEPWKICFCSKSGFDGCMAELWLLTAAAATAEISIIKIGLVYVIMIVITLWRHPAPSPCSHSQLTYIHYTLISCGAVFKRDFCVCVCMCMCAVLLFCPACRCTRIGSSSSLSRMIHSSVLSEYNSLCKRGD